MCDTPNEWQLALTAFQHSASNLDNILHQTQNDLVTLIGYDSPWGRGDTYWFRDIYLDFFRQQERVSHFIWSPSFSQELNSWEQEAYRECFNDLVFIWKHLCKRHDFIEKLLLVLWDILTLNFLWWFLNSPSSPHESLRLRVRIRGTISTLLENIDRVMSLSQFYENMHPDFTYELQAIQRKCREYEAQINRE